jgi:membrane protein DedA with SNARE-associated domain
MEQFMTEFAGQFTYVGIVLLLLAGGFGLPLPEDIPLLAGGYLAGKGVVELELLIPLCLFSVLLGDSALWFLGRRYHWALSKLPFIGRFLSPERLIRARQMLADHGGKFLFAARFMPGLRAVCFATAGALEVPYWKLLVYDGAAALVSVPTLILLAWYFGERIEKWIMSAQLGIAGVIGVAVVIVAFKLYRSRRARSVKPPVTADSVDA